MSETTPHIVLALDLGTTLGWALSVDHVITEWGVESFKVSNERHNDGGHRLLRFHNWLCEWFEKYPITEIFYEESPLMGFKSQSSAIVNIQMRGIASFICAAADIPFIAIHGSTLKKAFAGSGHAKKEEMCATAHQLGWDGGKIGTDLDNDAADACAQIYCILRERGISVRFG